MVVSVGEEAPDFTLLDSDSMNLIFLILTESGK